MTTTQKQRDEEIRDRMILFIDYFVGAYNKHKYMEEKTGISARKWQNLFHRAQMPTVELLWGLGEYQPAYLTWIVTGEAGPEQIDLIQKMKKDQEIFDQTPITITSEEAEKLADEFFRQSSRKRKNE